MVHRAIYLRYRNLKKMTTSQGAFYVPESATDAPLKQDQLSTSLSSKEAAARLKHAELKVHIQKQVTRRRNSYEGHVRTVEEQVDEVRAQRDQHLAKIQLDFSTLLEALTQRKKELELEVNREAFIRQEILEQQRGLLLDKIKELSGIERDAEGLEKVARGQSPEKLAADCDGLRNTVDQVVQTHVEQDAATSWDPAAKADVELDMGPDVEPTLSTRGRVSAPEPKKKGFFRKLSKSMGASTSGVVDAAPARS